MQSYKRPLAADLRLFFVVPVNSDTRGTGSLQQAGRLRETLGGAWAHISTEKRPRLPYEHPVYAQTARNRRSTNAISCANTCGGSIRMVYTSAAEPQDVQVRT